MRFDPTHHMHHSGPGAKFLAAKRCKECLRGGKFDCHAGLTHWEDRWAVEKKHWPGPRELHICFGKVLEPFPPGLPGGV